MHVSPQIKFEKNGLTPSVKEAGKRKSDKKCANCMLNIDRCICANLKREIGNSKIAVATRLTLVIHRREISKTTNTGGLALRILENGKLFVRGNDPLEKLMELVLDPAYLPIILFPSEDSEELSEESVKRFRFENLQKPINLIVPDGSWRQASKIHYRYPEFKELRRFRVEQEKSGKPFWNPRWESRAFGLTTLEAIAYAFLILEGENVGLKLFSALGLKLNAIKEGRPRPFNIGG